MLEYIESTKREFVYDVREQYSGCKVLMIDLDLYAMPDVTGIVYAISRSDETFEELCDLQQQLRDEDKLVMIVGSYGGGGIGVQYQYEL